MADPLAVVLSTDPAQAQLTTFAILLGLVLWVGTAVAGIRFARWLFRTRRRSTKADEPTPKP